MAGTNGGAARRGRSAARGTQSERDSRTATLQPEPEQETVPLADKLEAARRRIKELEEEVRIRTELETIEARIRQLEGTSRPADNCRELVAPVAAFLIQRAPKTQELLLYKGKTIKEAQDFFYYAELKWREDSDITWNIDAAKVTHCASCFKGITRDV